MMRRTAAATLLGLLLVAGCAAGSAVSDYGKVIKGSADATVRAEVRPGQRFSLTVPDNPSVGDDWELVEVPDAKVASFISEEHEGESDLPGAGGTAYFVFNGKQPGSTEIRLRNCRMCRQTPAPEGGGQTVEAVFVITVG
ncbi:hypothetical protein GCM10022224_087490 [Nonomuraea antimicrobica]|uniref:Proteinase inhibitor I42 chagasin domain-containing protein n=1 Tax=Nonomuraea antimicrobica TaxID=561173 RepID=A0ABP7DRC0_9ACTN